MIVVVNNKQDAKQVENLIKWIQGQGVEVRRMPGEHSTVLGLIGDTKKIDLELIQSMDVVESARRIQEPYKNANRKFHPDDTIVEVKGHKFGGNHFQVIAGPCSVESEAQVIAIAKAVKDAGATLLRGGAFKPRTSPYSFQGLGGTGIEMLLKASKETGLPIVSEIMSVTHLDLFRDVDIVQVGARNMQNFELLKELGRTKKPILLKRGLANTIEEWLMSAEYIMSEGNNEVILCERGIRTFEPSTRNTLDLSAIPLVKELTHLPVIVDPSHASGLSKLVHPMSLAAIGAGTDGLLIEVHNDPIHALCDGAQSLRPEQFADLMKKIDLMLPVVGRKRDA